MRKAMFWMGLAGLLAASPGCDGFNNDDDLIVNPQEVAQVASRLITAGRWRIEQYIDEGVDKSALYVTYTFDFLPDNTVRVNGQTGSWQLTRDDDDVELNLLLPADRFLEELNEDWDVKEAAFDRMLLEDDDDDGAAERSTLLLMKVF